MQGGRFSRIRAFSYVYSRLLLFTTILWQVSIHAAFQQPPLQTCSSLSTWTTRRLRPAFTSSPSTDGPASFVHSNLVASSSP
ncbi:hypothetical protein BDY24DRAFT_419524 [Mrakia frigida]|uniref:uncharacterized protein n=1 Tax=Mrakia frigida TaxID=29902 RepID=UPI003FCC160C